ncbi:MAG: LemA family protein [Thermoleophilaceae bacterium]|nr:LemA family protein [Thermoleophilaceae bacterium]
MPLPIFAGAAASLLAVWAGYSYNYLIHARTKVREGMSGVDVQLKLRHDLVPNLNEAVRAYAEHEQEALRAAAAHRCRAIAAQSPTDIEVAENALAAEVSRLLAVAEQNPHLKAADRFIALSAELRAIEDEIQAARTLYNANVEFYNSRAQRIPLSLVAMWMTPKSFQYLRLDPIDFDLGRSRVGEFAA